jgi:hypothetical protein
LDTCVLLGLRGGGGGGGGEKRVEETCSAQVLEGLLSGNRAINGSLWGLASFLALGRRGSGLPKASRSGRGHQMLEGQLGPLRKEGSAPHISNILLRTSLFCCLDIAANCSKP